MLLSVSVNVLVHLLFGSSSCWLVIVCLLMKYLYIPMPILSILKLVWMYEDITIVSHASSPNTTIRRSSTGSVKSDADSASTVIYSSVTRNTNLSPPQLLEVGMHSLWLYSYVLNLFNLFCENKNIVSPSCCYMVFFKMSHTKIPFLFCSWELPISNGGPWVPTFTVSTHIDALASWHSY